MREDIEKQLKLKIYYLGVKHDKLKKESKNNRMKLQSETNPKKIKLLKVKAYEISRKIRINRKEIKIAKSELEEFNINKTRERKILNKNN